MERSMQLTVQKQPSGPARASKETEVSVGSKEHLSRQLCCEFTISTWSKRKIRFVSLRSESTCDILPSACEEKSSDSRMRFRSDSSGYIHFNIRCTWLKKCLRHDQETLSCSPSRGYFKYWSPTRGFVSSLVLLGKLNPHVWEMLQWSFSLPVPIIEHNSRCTDETIGRSEWMLSQSLPEEVIQ